jgi:hypothetical protein
MAERRVGIVKRALKKACAGNTRWMEQLGEVQLMVNTMVSQVTGYTPMRMMFGMDEVKVTNPSLLTNLMTNLRAGCQELKQGDVKQKILEMQAKLDQCNWKRLDELESRRDKQRALGIEDHFTISVGDLALVKKESSKGALDTQWLGPFLVVGMNLTTGTYMLRTDDTKARITDMEYSGDILKKFNRSASDQHILDRLQNGVGQSYIVEQIVDHQLDIERWDLNNKATVMQNTWFLVQWRGFCAAEDQSWESLAKMRRKPALLEYLMERNALRKKLIGLLGLDALLGITAAELKERRLKLRRGRS